MTERERALLQGKKINPLTANESALAYAVAHGGGSEPTYETVAEIEVGTMEKPEGTPYYVFVADEAFPAVDEETYYFNSSNNPSDTVLSYEGQVMGILWNAKTEEADIIPIDQSKPWYGFTKVDNKSGIISDTPDLSNTTVRILKKVEQGGDIPEGLKPTYEFDFSAEPEEGSFTATPASGVTYAAIASALAETPHVYAKITFPSAMGLVVTARFNENITGDGQTGYYASALVLIAGDPTAIGLTIGDNAGQTVCAGTIKTLAVSN